MNNKPIEDGPFSESFFLEINTKVGCVVNCEYCPQDRFLMEYFKTGGPMEMSFDLFKNCLDKVPTEVGIIFSGMCEPWLNRQCTKMVEYAFETDHKVMVFTTLMGMSLNNLKRLERINFADDCGFVVHLPSIEGWEKIIIDDDYLDKIRFLMKSNITPRFHYYGSKVDEKLEEIIGSKNLNKMTLNDRSGNIINNKLPVLWYSAKKKGKIFCSRNLRVNVLLPNGKVFLCCNDYSLDYILGDLTKIRYEDLFVGKEFIRVSRAMSDESMDVLCRRCYFAYNDES